MTKDKDLRMAKEVYREKGMDGWMERFIRRGLMKRWVKRRFIERWMMDG